MPTLPPTVSVRRRAPWARVYHAALGATWLAVALTLLLWGLDYYLTPLGARPDHAGYDLFRPTGTVGNRLGVIGTALLLVGVATYSTRKRWGRLGGVGRLRGWLSFHIWCCTLGPFLILLHTSFKVGGLVSIAFWSMVTVVASGVLGRYVYVHIPKAVNGRFLERDELEAERAALQAELAERYALGDLPEAPAAPSGLWASLGAAAVGDRRARRRAHAVRARLDAAGVPGAERDTVVDLVRRADRLALGAALLQPFGRIFRYWHAIHLPLAIVMALVLLVHIAVAVAFGYAWS